MFLFPAHFISLFVFFSSVFRCSLSRLSNCDVEGLEYERHYQESVHSLQSFSLRAANMLGLKGKN